MKLLESNVLLTTVKVESVFAEAKQNVQSRVVQNE